TGSPDDRELRGIAPAPPAVPPAATRALALGMEAIAERYRLIMPPLVSTGIWPEFRRSEAHDVLIDWIGAGRGVARGMGWGVSVGTRVGARRWTLISGVV